MTEKDIADALAAKLLEVAMNELRAAQLREKEQDEKFVAAIARMLEWAYAIRGVNYPERLLRRLLARTAPAWRDDAPA